MSEFGAMNIADSLKKSWVDANGKSLMTGKSSQQAVPSVEVVMPDKQINDRLTALETDIAVLRNSIIALSDKVLSLEFPLQDLPPIKKPKKAKK